jgi:hypothetical protein
MTARLQEPRCPDTVAPALEAATTYFEHNMERIEAMDFSIESRVIEAACKTLVKCLDQTPRLDCDRQCPNRSGNGLEDRAGVRLRVGGIRASGWQRKPIRSHGAHAVSTSFIFAYAGESVPDLTCVVPPE